jgi:putative ABC transport system permease protein
MESNHTEKFKVFKNYMITAYRNLLRFKLDSFLNISGLVIGLSAALLITLFVSNERGYDSFWQDSERLYRVQTRWVLQGRDDINIVDTSGPLKAALESYFPTELEAVARFHVQQPIINTGLESFADLVSFADPEILDIFNFEILAGDARLALASNSSIVINETLAKKYFGDEDPIGKTLTLDVDYLKRDYQVLAVMQDLPDNTHLDIQAMIKIDENDFIDNNGAWMFSNWNAANNHTYFKLRPGIDIADINSRIDDFADASIPDDDGKASVYTKLTTLSVPDIHLRSKAAGSRKPGGDIEIVIAFSVIALLIVIVATINFVNLSTARAGQRAREIALRKVMGANRSQLITQHLGESLLVLAFSIVMTVMAVELALPFFSRMLAMNLALDIADPKTLAGMVLATITIGGLSGIYPALILSSYPPSSTLRANQSIETGGTVKARNVLIVFQTAVTVSLIVATIVVYAQLTYFRLLDRGFEPGQLLVIEQVSRNEVADKQAAFKKEVQNLPGVSSVSLSYEAPTNFSENNTRLRIPGESEDESYPLGSTNVDYDYLDALKIPLLAGRFYQRDMARDLLPSTDDLSDGDVLQGNIVINARAVQTMNMGTPEQAIGRVVENLFPMDDGGQGKILLTIIGVIGDANLHSVKKPVRPEVYELESYYHNLLVRYDGEPAQVLDQVRAVWQDMMGATPFEYFYVDQALATEFRSEVNQANIFLGFAILTMVVGCLGLYGLAAFVTECRRREMGIRKILGASIRDILTLLLGQFSRLVLAANLIAWPVIYMLMSNWLEQYPFRIGAGWIVGFCIIAGVLASFVVAATVGSQAWGVARANPIQAIRHE